MFVSEGEYYFINGCLEYPVDTQKICEFVHAITPNKTVAEINFYSVSPKEIVYNDIWEDIVPYARYTHYLLESDFPYVIESLDFELPTVTCRLVVTFFDSPYYGISLLLNNETLPDEVFLKKLTVSFYMHFNPIYGNDGVEKVVLPFNELNKTTFDLFNGNFAISRFLCKQIFDGVPTELAYGDGVIWDDGIYFRNCSRITVKAVFKKIVKLVAKSPPKSL